MNGALTLGTAGHVDHGKTRLVEALTGKNTDRLPEETRRGISIELGYAPLPLSRGGQISVVDVPGHERFVRTMVAGASGIDVFLLVIDAREGPEAQTHEHLRILRLLGVEYGVVAVTKIDAAESDMVALAVRTARELVPGSEVVPVSAMTGQGVPELLAAIESLAGVAARRPRHGPARMFVDRVFTVPGAGTVVTGTLWSGQISRGDTLEIAPKGFPVRVRNVQVHDQDLATATAGQRVAANLVGDRAHHRPQRGDALIEPGAYKPTFRLDVALIDADRLANGMRLLVCHGARDVPARVRLMDDRYAQLRLDEGVMAARGDHVVLWQGTTLGGGRVLHPRPPRTLDPERAKALDTDDPREIIRALVGPPTPVGILRELVGDQGLACCEDAHVEAGGWIFSSEWIDQLSRHLHDAIGNQDDRPTTGMPLASVGDGAWVPAALPLLGLEARGGKVFACKRTDGRPRPTSRIPDRIQRLLAGDKVSPFPVENRNLAIELERLGLVVRLGDGTCLATGGYRHARKVLADECNLNGTVTLGRYRDLLGTSRRVAQLVLERLDSDRVTLRVGESRRLRRRENPARSGHEGLSE